MIAVLYQLGINIRLFFRNLMALLYGYLFPTIFLIAFWVLYRHESVPLIRHMGELLTVTALGGACFGLPTTMVSERERGVWRRYRLAPIPTSRLILSTVLARYFLLLSAALLQLLLAMGIGMPLPGHLFDLWMAFTLVAFAFLGLGLVIAMLADTVPAVQALGQCIFLPMLIIGGVAVRLESLPVWAQHLSAFFPGRYAVEAIQVSVSGGGVRGAGFSLMALLLIGGASCLAAARLFRWDARERFITSSGKGWIGIALVAWVAVGVMAETTNRITIAGSGASEDRETSIPLTDSLARLDSLPAGEIAPAPDTESSGTGDSAAQVIEEPVQTAEIEAAAPPPASPEVISRPASWQEVTLEDIDRDLRFDQLPPDEGVISPIATSFDRISPEFAEQLQCVRANLGFWRPGQTKDPIQRVRNYLYIAAVPDMFQFEEFERWVPLAVYDHLKFIYPEEQFIKVLYWIATHPDEGDVDAASRLPSVCIDVGGPEDEEMLRERTTFYALKLLGRITGKIEPQ